MNNDKKDIEKKTALEDTDCTHCVYYDYDEDYDDYVCNLSLDEDEFVRLTAYGSGRSVRCPYFRFYDEYKSVRRQN